MLHFQGAATCPALLANQLQAEHANLKSLKYKMLQDPKPFYVAMMSYVENSASDLVGQVTGQAWGSGN